ncbi:RNA polymerase sigma factor [Streptomyces sp. NPDC001663]|uniref:RNA polymerase sigma factor n=1 Tax=Streptomyces sp. NPDC001663 TaxID=3364597 RepID=UPI0036B3D115
MRAAEEGEFDAFFRQQYPALVLHLVAQGESLQTARDAAQEAMVKACQWWQDLQEPIPWVRLTARRCAWRNGRREGQRRVKEQHALAQRPVAEASPEDGLVMREEQQRVIALLHGLPSAQQATVAYAFDGYATKEIADRLNVSEATVRSNLRHARRQLQGWLAARKQQEADADDR